MEIGALFRCELAKRLGEDSPPRAPATRPRALRAQSASLCCPTMARPAASSPGTAPPSPGNDTRFTFTDAPPSWAHLNGWLSMIVGQAWEPPRQRGQSVLLVPLRPPCFLVTPLIVGQKRQMEPRMTHNHGLPLLCYASRQHSCQDPLFVRSGTTSSCHW